MATIRLSISGVADDVAPVWPHLPRIVRAFQPFGITFAVEKGLTVETDPELNHGWPDLVERLSNLSMQTQPPAPAHMVVTTIPPNYHLDVNGELKLPSRGIIAIYTGSSIYGPGGPSSRPDLLSQVCIHELGHMLNLTHGDTYGAGYSSAMMQTTNRLEQPVLSAWQAATAEAQQGGEAPIPAPNGAVLYYPFDAACRGLLRTAATDSTWWPWGRKFRDEESDPAEFQDRTLGVSLRPHGQTGKRHPDSGLYFTMELRNRGKQPIHLPERLHPKFGTMRIAITGESGETRVYQSPNFRCSRAQTVLLPGQTIHRSFALSSLVDRAMFPAPGNYSCAVSILQGHGPHAATFARGTMKLRIADESRQSAVPKSSAGRFHAQYQRAVRSPGGTARTEQLRGCVQGAAPAAIRHAAAHRLAVERMRRGTDWRRILKEYEKRYPAPLGAELHETLRQTGEGWERLKVRLARKRKR